MSMKKILISTALGLSIATAFPASVAGAEHPEQARPSARTAAAPELLENAKKLQSQANRIGKAKSPAEREKLLQEHFQVMREGMMLTLSMMEASPGGPGTGMMGGDGMMGMMGMMQDGPMHQGMMRGPMMMDGPCGLPGMDLSEDQIKRINAVHDGVRKQRWELMGKLMDEQVKLRDLYGAEKRDAAAIGAQHQRIFDLQRQVVEAGVTAQNQVEELLTPEQRKTLRESWRRGYMGGGMMGGGMMGGMIGAPGMMGR